MTNPNALLHRRDVVNELLRDRGDLLVGSEHPALSGAHVANGDHARRAGGGLAGGDRDPLAV